MGEWELNEPTLVRVHSATNASEILGQILQGFDTQVGQDT